MTLAPPPSVFHYADYRSFLRDVHRARKKARIGWSHAVWAKQLKLKSPSTLVMILNGQRHPGDVLTGRLAAYLELNPEETAFFSDLVRLQKVKNDIRLSTLLCEKLAKRHPDRRFHYIDLERFASISNWHYAAIRELVRTPGFREDEASICRSLRYPVTERDVGEAIRVLLKLGLLKRVAGRLQTVDEHVETPSDHASEALRRFHEQGLEHARQSLRALEPSEREITGTCFVMPRRRLAEAKRRLREFLNAFCDEVEAADGEDVYQLQLALFPLTDVKRASS